MKDSKIEWTNHTFNPWHGCTKVSPGCDHCYAETLSTRWGRKIWGPDSERLFFGDKHWNEPVVWNREAIADGVRRRVFCGSMCDWAEGRPDQAEARARLFALIDATPQLDWLLLTKRPGAIRHLVPASWLETPPANVWYGTSVENQEQADRRIPQLLQVPAVVRFLSCEPLLGPIELCDVSDWSNAYDWWGKEILGPNGISWVIAGGESGNGARPMHPDWARSLRDQCQAAGIAYHFKQWGEWVVSSMVPPCPDTGHYFWHPDQVLMVKVGKKAAGRLLDGRTWDEFPEPQVEAGAR